MAPRVNEGTSKKGMNRGAWTHEEDQKLSQFIQLHGAKRWKTIAIKSGLNRCGKSCRLRWLNYLRPNIKRGNISNEEEDLILRLHRLLGNRWSLIAGRLPGRTDNEIKNYWNSHLCKKLMNKNNEKARAPAQQQPSPPAKEASRSEPREPTTTSDENEGTNGPVAAALNPPEINFNVNELFDFSMEGCHGLDWVNRFLELEEDGLMNSERR
ncbi:hypothetical protein SAY87_019595 [Trapa incisa]|uniref:Uncharacterized protein n=2 Tax=Trapa TaxID=22665 RepID=A0AAN7LVX7_TRANT|nr:hypothetical protein SAY87_019595 [Trapa incisa]KAK4793662.1 hypothetical protein SAY86_024097 [Trapa natans]